MSAPSGALAFVRRRTDPCRAWRQRAHPYIPPTLTRSAFDTAVRGVRVAAQQAVESNVLRVERHRMSAQDAYFAGPFAAATGHPGALWNLSVVGERRETTSQGRVYWSVMHDPTARDPYLFLRHERQCPVPGGVLGLHTTVRIEPPRDGDDALVTYAVEGELHGAAILPTLQRLTGDSLLARDVWFTKPQLAAGLAMVATAGPETPLSARIRAGAGLVTYELSEEILFGTASDLVARIPQLVLPSPVLHWEVEGVTREGGAISCAVGLDAMGCVRVRFILPPLANGRAWTDFLDRAFQAWFTTEFIERIPNEVDPPAEDGALAM